MSTDTADKKRPDAAQASDEIDFLGLLSTIWRGKWIIAICAILATLAGGYYAFEVAKPLYRANSVLILDEQQPSIVDFESVVPGVSNDLPAINTEVEVIRSRKLITLLVQRMNLTEDPEFNQTLTPKSLLSIDGILDRVLSRAPKEYSDQQILDATVDMALSRINVASVPQTYVFRITVTSEDPTKAAEIANVLAEIYILDQLEVKFELTQQATEWLTGRVAELQVELEETEAAAKDFAANSALVSPEALLALNRQIKDLRDRRDGLEESQAETTALLLALNAAREADDYAEMTALTADRMRLADRTAMLEGDADARAGFDQRFASVVSGIDLELARFGAQLENLGETIADLEEEVAVQSADLVTLQQFQRETEASRLIFEYFLNRLKETSVQQGIQQPDSRVLSDAAVPTSPSSPRKVLISAVSLILGAGLGALLVVLNELRNSTFRTPDELETLTGQRVIGQIPLIPSRKRSSVIEYLRDKPNSAASEAIRNMRTSLLLSDVDNPPQVIMSTSSLPGEGKTTQSLSLTQNFSSMGKKVLLIEGDVRRRVFSEYFDVKREQGLVAILSGETTLSEAVAHVDQIGADVLIGEKSKANAADIFSSKKFAALIEEARSTYDVIIIDTPPVLVVTDARIIGKSVDAILYSVKWDSTTKTQVREGLKMFKSVDLSVAGLVLSQINPKGMKKYGYGGEYGAYGAYGSKYYNDD